MSDDGAIDDELAIAGGVSIDDTTEASGASSIIESTSIDTGLWGNNPGIDLFDLIGYLHFGSFWGVDDDLGYLINL